MSECTVVVEVQDPRTQTIIQRQSSKYNHVHYYRANKLVAALLAMVAQRESGGIRDVLVRLMRLREPNFELTPISHYVYGGESPDKEGFFNFTFWELFARVRTRGDILLGFTSRDTEVGDLSAIALNPEDKSVVKKWRSDHHLIVLTR